ncbi:unnamed protein product [Medioppia subpectinata]|uniref:glutathione transferase n=1 Tax=Medioppia subpectinata TaxID=1979941 RepID=A0A7R9KXJ5_9ACAR|nr:unnamed protein product [Medioppia subpectinata]CAG2111717.1 unnamed protein product [Medioppia subpectinata]
MEWGRGQSIRLLLKYAGIQFTDKGYANPMDWNSGKFTLGLDYPNILYYIDHDLKLIQSIAIMRYLGKKHGLSAISEPQRDVQYMAAQQLQDVLQGLAAIMYGPGDGEANPRPISLALSSLSWIFILAYNVLDILRLYAPESVAKHPTIGQYLDIFEALPAIKA